MHRLLHSCIIFLSLSLLVTTTSCKSVKTDNGKHKGWFKNTNNPHNPLSTNPGHGKSPAKGNGNASPSGKAKKK
ncbi:MAG: hypothetical protein ACXVNQ_04335 [Bacteroidia bacterium]